MEITKAAKELEIGEGTKTSPQIERGIAAKDFYSLKWPTPWVSATPAFDAPAKT